MASWINSQYFSGPYLLPISSYFLGKFLLYKNTLQINSNITCHTFYTCICNTYNFLKQKGWSFIYPRARFSSLNLALRLWNLPYSMAHIFWHHFVHILCSYSLFIFFSLFRFCRFLGSHIVILQKEDSNEELTVVFESDGQIKAATLEKLVERITHDSFTSGKFQKTGKERIINNN